MSNLDLTIAEIMYGDTEVLKIMKGDTQKWPPVVAVSGTLTHVTSSIQLPATISKGSTFTATLTVDTDYILSSVVVMMGSTDISSTAYSNGTITIQSVTDDVTITATANYMYVEDGLIFHLDGINKGETANAWTDRIGSIVYSVHGSVTPIDKGWSFPGTTSDYLSTSSQPSATSEDLTVEVCFKPESTSTAMIYGPGSRVANKAIFYKDNNAFLFMQDNYTYSYTVTSGDKYTMSFNQSRGLVNKSDVTKDSSTSFITVRSTAASYIGVRRTTSNWLAPFQGELYSIRIYNRRLTRDEILYNQSTDNTRFNLGLT